jgi:hypothetical protein
MTRQTIDRLGMMSYGLLIFGIVNGWIRKDLSKATLESLPVLIPMIAVNLVGVITAFYCLFCFIRHLFMENTRVGAGGKALWLILLLVGHLLTMPVYWYLHIARECVVGERNPSPIGHSPPATSTLA